MAVAAKMRDFMARSSWIRRMFEEGARLKEEHGAENVHDFSLGNPDLPPPPLLQEALQKEAARRDPGIHGYMPNSGYPYVREKVAVQVGSEQGVELSRNDIIMTCGAAGALNVVIKSILDPGDEVIILSPYFVEYNFYIDNHGGVPVIVRTAGDFSLDLKALEEAVTAKTRAVIINSPNNPTGQVYSARELEELAGILSDRGRQYGSTIYLVSDEPYRNIVFDGLKVPGTLAACKNAIVVSSYSKELSLAGERIGYLAIHPEITDKEELAGAMNLANRILGFVNAPALMQRVVADVQGAGVDNRIYSDRREKFRAILEEAGYNFVLPKGGFYFFPESPLKDDAAFVELLKKEKILAVPGQGFGTPGYFRLSFCVEDKIIDRATPGFARAMEAASAAG
ncbi:MAG: pyridoxal phosphate-dependent aminotransferase [Desulfurivibrionaceae bacterium]